MKGSAKIQKRKGTPLQEYPSVYLRKYELLLTFQLFFQSSQSIDITQSCRSSLVLDSRSFFSLRRFLCVRSSLLFSSFFCLSNIFENAAVRQGFVPSNIW